MTYNFSDFLRIVAGAVGDKRLAIRIRDANMLSSLLKDLEFDSPGLVEMQLALEENHKVFLQCEEINQCKTLGDVFRLLLNRLPE